MRKLFMGFFVGALFLVNVQAVSASLVTITQEGEIIIKVLSSEDPVTLEIPKKDDIELKEVAKTTTSADASVSVERDGENVVLNITTSDGSKTLDVTNYQDGLIEIEEVEPTKFIRITFNGDDFEIEQGGLTATTTFPINVDAKRNELSLTTSSGKNFLFVLPAEAIESIMRTKLISQVDSAKSLEIVEQEDGSLAYIIEGQKVINVFNVYDYAIDVTAKVSAVTGEVINIDNPEWLSILNFLFV